MGSTGLTAQGAVSGGAQEECTTSVERVFEHEFRAIAHLHDLRSVLLAVEIYLHRQADRQDLGVGLPLKRIAADLPDTARVDRVTRFTKRQAGEVTLECPQRALVDWIDELHHLAVEARVVELLGVVHEAVALEPSRHQPQKLTLPVEEPEAGALLVG